MINLYTKGLLLGHTFFSYFSISRNLKDPKPNGNYWNLQLKIFLECRLISPFTGTYDLMIILWTLYEKNCYPLDYITFTFTFNIQGKKNREFLFCESVPILILMILKSKLKYHSELRNQNSNMRINFFNNPKLKSWIFCMFCELSLLLTRCSEARMNSNENHSFKEEVLFYNNVYI